MAVDHKKQVNSVALLVDTELEADALSPPAYAFPRWSERSEDYMLLKVGSLAWNPFPFAPSYFAAHQMELVEFQNCPLPKCPHPRGPRHRARAL